MKRVIRLTESDLVRIVKRVINEQTLPSSKNPSSFVKTVKEFVINKEKYKMTFRNAANPDGVVFTTRVSKTPDKVDPNTKKVLAYGPYTIILESDPINLRFDFTCSSGARFIQATIKDPQVMVQNPIQNNKTYRGKEIESLLKQLSPSTIVEVNPFLSEFQKQFCG